MFNRLAGVFSGLAFFRILLAALVMALVIGCTFLPEGDSQIVYVSDTDGDQEIYLLDPESGKSSRLTNNGTADEEPRWSHDGRQIAYVSRETGDKEINVVDKEGNQLSRLTNNPGLDASPRWSPAEQKLAYVSELEEEGNDLTEIYSIAVEDREISQVTFEGAAEELGDWSPNGEWIVFYNQEPEADRGLWLRNPEGVNLLRLTEGEDTQPCWSPDGKYIAFVRQQEDAKAIFLARRAKDGSWKDGVDETRLTHGGFDDYSPVWHPNSKTIAFVSTRDGNPEIYTMQADGANQHRLTTNKADDLSPVYSPSGKQMAIVTDLYGSADILVMDADGSNQRRLTKNGGDDISPDW
jgi:TolB protein